MTINYNKYGIQEKSIPKIYANRILISKNQLETTQITVDCNVIFDFPSFNEFVKFCSADCFDYLFQNYIFYFDPNGTQLDLEVLNSANLTDIITETNSFLLNDVELNQTFNKVAFDTENNNLQANLLKYSRELPNGERYYQLSYQTKFDIPLQSLKGNNIYFIAGVLVQDPQITFELNYGDFGINSGITQYSNYEIFDASDNQPIRGPLTVENIISTGEIQNKGIIYTISQNQKTYPAGEIPDDVDALIVLANDAIRDNTFSSIKGTLWVGGVHKHKNRFMAGSQHMMESHPYLDSNVVANKKIIDLRKIKLLESSKVDFSSVFDNIENLNDLLELGDAS
mgnify:CR=1 FL=1